MPLRPAVAAVAAAMVLLPAVQLTVRWAEHGSRPRSELPASWQMYTVVAPAAYTGVDARGRERRLDAASLPPFVREVDTGAHVPDRLCDRHPELVAVRRTGGTEPGAFAC